MHLLVNVQSDSLHLPVWNLPCCSFTPHSKLHVHWSMRVWSSARWNSVYQSGDVPQRENVHRHRHSHSLSFSLLRSHSLFVGYCQWKWTVEETGEHHPWLSFLDRLQWRQNRSTSPRNGLNQMHSSGGITQLGDFNSSQTPAFVYFHLFLLSVTNPKHNKKPSNLNKAAVYSRSLWRNTLQPSWN